MLRINFFINFVLSIELIHYIYTTFKNHHMNNSKEQTIFYAENLRYLRKKMGLTQSDVADKIGIHYKTLGNQEKGRHEPSIMYIKRYCDFFNVRAHLFLFTNIKENDNSFLNNSINKL